MRRDHEPAVWRDWFWSWWRLEYTRGALQPNCHLFPSPAQPIAYYKYLPFFYSYFSPENLFSLSSVWLRRPISSQPPINSSLNRSWNHYSLSCFLLVLKILSLSRFLEDYRTSFSRLLIGTSIRLIWILLLDGDWTIRVAFMYIWSCYEFSK